jgi:hypothetical protein
MPIRVLLLVVLANCGCGGASTSLAPIDVRAQQNQQRAALAILAHVADAGAIESLAESIYCGAGGTLRRASQPTVDAGVPCP